MIRRDGDRPKALHPQASVGVGSQRQMLRDIKESLSHLRRDPPSSVVPSPLSSSSSHSAAPKSDAMQIKDDLMNSGALQQSTAAASGGGGCGGGGILSSNSSECRTASVVKSSSYGYRQKALAAIRSSLLPFANSDRPGGAGQHELSSASSTTSESSSPSQNTSSSFSPNGLDKDVITHQQLVQHLMAMGHSEESAVRALKLPVSKLVESSNEASLKQQEWGQPINGLTRPSSVGVGLMNLKPLRKSSLQDAPSWDRGATDSSTGSTRSDSPSISIMGLQPGILPDPPRLINTTPGPTCDGNGLLSHAHVQLSRQQSPNFPPEEPPPPPPPPRGVPGPPPTPPRGTTPPPQSQYGASSGLVSGQVQHFLMRMSPVPQISSRSQAASYGSSCSSTSQRGTSPVSFGRMPLGASNIAQPQQQLVQKFQAMSPYSNSTSSSSQVDPPPPYPSGSTNSPASLSSLYSSPPPSYASSSSGRQSPTPTISSSEYSVPPVLNIHKRTPPPMFPASPPASSPQPHIFQPGSPSHSSTAATIVTTAVPRPAPLQAWSARHAKSQSPIIMQSVKSTQVQKPVLMTAVAPTSPPINATSSTFPSSTTSSNLPISYSSSVQSEATMSVSSTSNTTTQHSTVQSSAISQSHPTHTATSTVQAFSSSVQNQSGNSSVYPPGRSHPSSPFYAKTQTAQTATAAQYSTPVPAQTPNPPPYTSQLGSSSNSSQLPPLYNSVISHQDVVVNPPPPYVASVQNVLRQDVATNKASTQLFTANQASRQDMAVNTAPSYTQLGVTQVMTAVPTTDPPSYATSVAALAAQRAAAASAASVLNNNVPMVSTSQAHNRLGGISTTSELVSTVESICTSQVTALSSANTNLVRETLNTNQGDAFSNYSTHSSLHRKQSPVAMDTASSASRSDSPVSHALSQSPVSFMSTTSTSSPSTQSDSTQESRRAPPPPPPPYKMASPIPARKVLSKEKEEERRETKVRNYSPAAYKFFMEQHVENILKFHQQREHRRQQLETEMAKVGLSEEAQCQMRKMLHQKESNYIRLKRAKMDKSMFTKIKTIGLGAFGEVALVRKVDTNHLYAMKTLRKSDVLKRNQVAHVKAERDILAEADNEWVVKLYYSFQDKDNLYFVMDYIPGGDLMSLLIKFGIFKEPLARFYIAELVLAVESVHKMGFIHRDIKPDNILIDRDGHIKLTDFGLCTGFRWTHNSKYYQRNGEHSRQDSIDPDEKWSNECHCNSSANLKPLERRRRREHQRCLAHSLVGTPNYIAPEVLMRTGYTQLCDWWSVGVILYEMLVGQPPFLANNPAETQYKVVNWESTLAIPKAASLSSEATDIALRMCCGPNKRLGKNGAEEIKSHPFFASIDFEGGLRKQPAPYIPRIRYPTDTSNFDPIDPDKLKNSDSGSSDESKFEDTFENGKHPEHAFFEFTFRRFFDDGGQAYPSRISVDDNDNQGSPVYV